MFYNLIKKTEKNRVVVMRLVVDSRRDFNGDLRSRVVNHRVTSDYTRTC